VFEGTLASFFLLLAGIALLYFGGEYLVDGASRLARTFGLSPMVIGLTVVAFGTSAPELAASLTAAMKGVPEIALANVVGSNIANLALVLPVAALIYPLVVKAPFLRREVPFMILVSALLAVLVQQGLLLRWVGAAMMLLLVLYIWFLLRIDSQTTVIPIEEGHSERPLWSALRVAFGVLMLALGARILVEGAIGASEALGLSHRVVGLTLVALGTSLPELATVIAAAKRHESDLILGNLVGSNIFNILCILGTTLMVHPLGISFHEVQFDLAVMLGVAVAILPMLYYRGRVGRKRGAVLLACYLVYVALLFA
jgi:cation:H+ antiporter